MKEFANTFVSFFKKPGILMAITFLLLYRLPEAILTKICPLFLTEKVSLGGLGLSTSEYGLAYGTLGVIGLLLGGILGGIRGSHGRISQVALADGDGHLVA